MKTIDQDVKFKGHDGYEMDAFISRPDDELKHPAIIVTHEIWGLEKQIKSVVGRLAEEGFVAIGPHLYSREKEVLTVENIEKAMGKVLSIPPDKRGDRVYVESIMGEMEEGPRKATELIFSGRESLEETMVKDLVECKEYLASNDHVLADNIGATGFCMGGGLTFQLATVSDIKAAVIFYGSNPRPIDNVKNIKGRIMGIYAGEDERINSGLSDLLSTFVKYKKEIDLKIYENAMHAFFNDTRPSYKDDAAKEAWERTVRFFKKNLMEI